MEYMANINKKIEKKLQFIYINHIIVYILSLFLSGCVYSFKGGSVPSHLKTIFIPIFEDQSGFGDPTLRDYFTQQVITAFRNDNTLQLADRNTADAILEGAITNVKEEAAIIEGGEKVSEIHIWVTVQITFKDLKLQKKIWEKSFSKWGAYPSGSGFTQRSIGIEEAVQKLTDEILNSTVAGW